MDAQDLLPCVVVHKFLFWFLRLERFHMNLPQRGVLVILVILQRVRLLALPSWAGLPACCQAVQGVFLCRGEIFIFSHRDVQTKVKGFISLASVCGGGHDNAARHEWANEPAVQLLCIRINKKGLPRMYTHSKDYHP